jgi:1,4-alpha-glucan branching enzyme
VCQARRGPLDLVGPPVAELAFGARAAELEVLHAGAAAPAAAVRELLALQASDWAFLITRGLAESYARERFDGHRRALGLALAGAGERELAPQLRNIAVDARPTALLAG